jgi:hypothetical protein
MSEETCKVCDETFPDEYDKFDPRAPVYADDYVYHLECEGDIYDEVYAEV